MTATGAGFLMTLSGTGWSGFPVISVRQTGVDMDYRLIGFLIRTADALGQGVCLGLFGDHASRGNITAVRNRDPSRNQTFDPDGDIVSHLGIKDLRLHADKRVVANPGRSVDQRLMGNRNPFADVNRVPVL